MCPACITTAALIVAGATSTGGLTALVVKKLRAKTGAKSIDTKTQTKGEQNGSSEDCAAS
ncbi:MAG: hypothetical protein ACREOO_13255 [bacterium]